MNNGSNYHGVRMFRGKDGIRIAQQANSFVKGGRMEKECRMKDEFGPTGVRT